MGRCSENLNFWSKPVGVMKILEFILSLLIVIMTSASFYTSILICNGFQLPTQQMAFVNFAGAFCCITLLISAAIYSLGIYRFPLLKRLPWKKLEIVYAGACAVLFFISMAISAHSSNNSKVPPVCTKNRNLHALFAAIAVFCVATLLLFVAQALYVLRHDDSLPIKTNDRPQNNESNVEDN